MSRDMKVEVNVLGKEYIYDFEDGDIRIYIRIRGKLVKEIHIYDSRDKYKDYHSYDLDIPIEILDVLAEALKDLKNREGL